jgi:hypothetical protein
MCCQQAKRWNAIISDYSSIHSAFTVKEAQKS